MKIHVTKKYIEQGVPEDPHYCPVARAIRKALNLITLSCVNVYEDTITWKKGGRYEEYKTPKKVAAFIKRFDNPKTDRGSLREFTFNLLIEKTS